MTLKNNTVLDCTVIDIYKIHNDAGNITVVENGLNIPFEVKRIYYLYDVPGGEARGGHAHYELEQFVIAASGSLDVILDDGKNKIRIKLNRPNLALHIVPGLWRELENFSSGSICLVLASHKYEENDYLRNYKKFINLKKKVMSRQGENREKNLQNIKQFWENEASEWGDLPQITIRDHYFRLHEINLLLSLIPFCGKILDIGCGTGFGTLFFSNRAKSIIGIDYSENMIKWANKFISDDDYKSKILEEFNPNGNILLKNNIRFETGNLLNLNLKQKYFDVILGQRILINMPTYENQLIALKNLRGNTEQNGLLIITEATNEGHLKTDQYREIFNLSKMEKYWHNNYLPEKKFSDWNETGWKIIQVLTFDTYMLLSKVIYPAAVGEEKCKFLSAANKAAYEIASVFRTYEAVQEIKEENLLKLYIERVLRYDKIEGKKIEKYVESLFDLPNWKGLGHQKLIIAKAI